MSVDLPNYRILEQIGMGAETKIYRARCMRTGKDYAVKIVKLTKPEDAGYIDLLRAEHAIGSVINHPVLRKNYELRMIRQRLRVRGAVLFMEYVNGIAMSDSGFSGTMDEILGYFRQVAEGLHAMHLAGFVHADLKPNNILVTPDGQVKLIDFGQSSKIHGAKSRIQGTIDYIAPEQVSRENLDQRTDVFGLGAALHRVLTGKPIPTEMNQVVTIYSQSLVGKRRSDGSESAVDKLPACIAKLIIDCCAYRPADRIADMTGVMERIRLARIILNKPPGEPVVGEEENVEEELEASSAAEDTPEESPPHTSKDLTGPVSDTPAPGS